MTEKSGRNTTLLEGAEERRDSLPGKGTASLEVSGSLVLVAHTCNPSYSGGRDQEDHSSKPAIGSQDPIFKKPFHKKGLVKWLKM
jgi:hypothetical protein